MHEIGWLATVGVVCIIVPLVILVAKLVTEGRAADVETFAVTDASFYEQAVAVMDIIFG
jgi:hypothetical protein